MKNKKIIIRLFFICCFCIFLFSLFFSFISQTNNINTEQTLEHLQDVGKETANAYHLKFKNFENIIKNTAQIIGTHQNSQEQIGEILSAVTNDKNEFERIWYVDSDRKLYNYKDNLKLDDPYDYIDDIFNGKSGITDPYISPYNKDNVVVVYAPVYREKIVVGGVAAIVKLQNDNYDSIYNDVFKNNGYVFTTSASGQIISGIKTDESLPYDSHYFDLLKNDVTFLLGSYETVLEDIHNNESGFISYKYNGKDRLVYYTPVQINNWYVFNIISSNVVNALNEKMNHATMMLVLKVVILFLIMFLYILYYFVKNSKQKQKMNNYLVKSHAKIEMILKQTSDRIFEYDIQKDSLILDAWNDYPKIILNHFLSNLHNYNFVSKEHENLLKDNFNNIIDNKEKVVFDAKFPYISKDNETWFHVSMIYMSQDNRLIGILRNSTKEMQEYNLLLQDQMFKNSVYSHALFMFAVNLKSKKIVIYQEDGFYHNIIDEPYEGDFTNLLISRIHELDRERASKFFSYENIQSIRHNYGKNSIEFRSWNEKNSQYKWVRYKIHFERQTSNNEILMIAYSADIDDEKSKQLEFEFKAKRDGLTGLLNKQTFNQMVDNYLSQRNQKIFYDAYIIVDLDNFKKVNDSLGHNVGDDVIKKVSEVIERESGDKAYIGRFGGDEFIVFLYNQQSYAEIEERADRIISHIKNNMNEYQVTASMGICFVGENESNKELFIKADKALYNSKNNGKNKFSVYKEGMK